MLRMNQTSSTTMKFVTFLLLLLTPGALKAQWHDAHSWSGNLCGSIEDDAILLNHLSNEITYQLWDTSYPSIIGSLALSDSSGQLSFYTNGLNILYPRRPILMENGSFPTSTNQGGTYPCGYPCVLNNVVCLTLPGNQFALLSLELDLSCLQNAPTSLFLNKIDMNANGAAGVTEKHAPVSMRRSGVYLAFGGAPRQWTRLVGGGAH